ncbi:MAG TPA: YaeQ family protein [Marinagarivorans sp.]
MALKSKVYKVSLSVSDTDRHHYQDYAFKVACHPSETEGRMCLRLAAFALFADPKLAFTRGLCATDEPDIWQKDDTGLIERWIDLGWPDEKRIAKACGLAEEVIVVAYGRNTGPWWQAIADKTSRFKRLRVLDAGEGVIDALSCLTAQNMALTATISDGTMWLSDGSNTVEIPLQWLKGT